jgi:maleate cis-trans isomerase
MKNEVEYGVRGILGLLVPQANTTAEPEVQIMLDPDIALLTGRLTSPQPEMRERLEDFLTNIDQFIATFSNAPLAGLGFLITGSTYHFEHSDEDAYFDQMSQRYGYPIVSAGQSIRRAFTALGAKRVGLVSPYPQWLTERSAAYWGRTGVEVVGIESPQAIGGFHNIYTLRNDAVLAAAERLLPLKPDLILLAGAGMPTLAPIMTLADQGVAAISSNFCMAWQLMQMSSGDYLNPDSLLRLMRREAPWRTAFRLRYPAACSV